MEIWLWQYNMEELCWQVRGQPCHVVLIYDQCFIGLNISKKLNDFEIESNEQEPICNYGLTNGWMNEQHVLHAPTGPKSRKILA